MPTDLKYLISTSCAVIAVLVGVMFFSPLALQFSDEGASRGGDWSMDVAEMLQAGEAPQALQVVDSLIAARGASLPRFAYFDRFLSEEERDDAANARADIYDLQWQRIEILSSMNRTEELRRALEDYVRVIGYRQEDARVMLEQLDGR